MLRIARLLRSLVPLAAPVLLVSLAPAARAQHFFSAAGGDDLDLFGYALANLGDLNGDGCDELAVGEPYWDSSTSSDAGRVTVLDGATGAILRTHDGTRATAHLGMAVASLGDLNSDGVRDYVVGSPGIDSPASNCGFFTAYSGATGALLKSVGGSVAGEALGGALASLDDVDGDGERDLIAGVPSLGEARLYDSSLNLITTLTGSASDSYGQVVVGLDDLDGDGVEEFAVTEPGYDSAFPLKLDRGRAVLYSGATRAQIASLLGLAAGDLFGQVIERLPDLDGDGVDDLAVGVPAADTVGTDNGQLLVFSGATRATLHTIQGAAAGDLLGFSIAALPDLDHDGIGDFAIGLYDGGASDLGAVEVRAGADAHVLWTVEGNSIPLVDADEHLGFSLEGGDWNGDGIGDVAFGDPGYSKFNLGTFTWTQPGRVELWLGAPAFTESFGAGWPGKLGIPQLDALAPPGFGTTLTVSVDNSAGFPTTGLLLVGTSTAAIPWKDGTLLVNADVASLLFPLPTFGALLDADIPNDPALAFVDLYVQVVEADPFASKKLSFTPGLRLRLGYDLP
ncbi:MAG: FG-GAP repeat protein [Planctomycetes bacterium]|nr:FG-GAP repeat protein [Planctomycetota bacterium]